MKVSKRKKVKRIALMRRDKRCPQCNESITDGGHYIPALGEWICHPCLIPDHA